MDKSQHLHASTLAFFAGGLSNVGVGVLSFSFLSSLSAGLFRFLVAGADEEAFGGGPDPLPGGGCLPGGPPLPGGTLPSGSLPACFLAFLYEEDGFLRMNI